ncbi:alpha-hydroxy acid oxidase [Burkholderia multivorans]|uniref:alpha-hydroxy acid oxidase n=1 Tax=Burkholderia multivorans TaxID=87883 RepID=UPI0021C2489D|nr:alpha-hydroxy acid oxidase [Burkholderia multivorans]MDR8761964.1 (S)-mandelate dehydrogenase [Burkholderia multivorans]MDR8766234.1 (S)-mandelate dehydrogenase [Burkholderia multivorans]MDR8769977.1 (S)-mandelate dehydrogenase [Burkholderia multivorans]MDR8792066.1 (S)-mandelate dehydrogenase [Burkholderia multivorans]MDR8794533.1 (S)-mandelate dehydrogenase [Burkholderia multivorans]
MPDPNLGAYNIEDLRRFAQRRLPKGIFEFVDRGSEDEVVLRENHAAFERIKLIPRALVDVSQRSARTSLFGHDISLPLVVGPTGVAGLLWYQGEVQLARAAAAAAVPFTVSTGSLTSLETIAAEAPGRLWFQLYMWPERAKSHALVERARQAGYEALVVTVDGVVSGNREYNLRNGFTVPFSYSRRNLADVMRHPRWLAGVLGRYLLNGGMPRYANMPPEFNRGVTAATPVSRSMARSESLTWDDLRDLRRRWPHALIVKGIMHAADALTALDCGADGIVVSNHGGRNLDAAPASIEIVAPIAEAVAGRLTVLMDGGVRRGSDVIKALALGADAVMIGRPALYGVAAGGQAGASRALAILREEIGRVMAQIGCKTVGEITRECATALTRR